MLSRRNLQHPIAVRHHAARPAGRIARLNVQANKKVAKKTSVVLIKDVPNCGSGSGCELPLFLVWSKALPAKIAAAGARSAAAMLLMNNGDAPLNVSSSLGGVRGLGACDAGKCTSRDVWAETLSEEPVVGGAVARLLGPHASALFVVSSSEPAPPPTPPPPTLPGSGRSYRLRSRPR